MATEYLEVYHGTAGCKYGHIGDYVLCRRREVPHRLWDDPDCNYGLAQMHLKNATLPNRAAVAVEAFEAAARHGHAFAAYNLGVAHLFGHGVLPNADLAAAWFEASGLPEGLLAASFGAGAAWNRFAATPRASRGAFG